MDIQNQIFKNNNLPKDRKTSSLVLGILLTMPVYMLVLFAFRNIYLPDMTREVLWLFSMYLPPIAGLILSKTPFKAISKVFMILMLLALGYGAYNFVQCYFIGHEGWDDLGYMFLWLMSTGVMRIFACLFLCTTIGWKKGAIYSVIGIATIAASFLLGFWA